MTKIIYYTTSSGENAVRSFMESLQKQDKAKIFRIIQTIEQYGITSILPHVKKLTGSPLWEIRVLGKSNIRIIYVVITEKAVLLLHGFLKKTQRTQAKEIEVASIRFKDYKKRA